MRRRDGSRGRRQNANFGQNIQSPRGYGQEGGDGQTQPPVQYVMVPVPVPQQAVPYFTGQQPVPQQYFGQSPFSYALPQPPEEQGNLRILGDISDINDHRIYDPPNRARASDRRQLPEEDDLDENDVFMFLLKRFSGACTFSEFVRNCDLFTTRSSIPLWFNRHSRRFNIYRDDGKIVYISLFYKDMKICKHYNRTQSCKRDNCDFFHVCRKFVRGNCKKRECHLSHSFKTVENRQIKEKLGIDNFTDADIKTVLNSNSPAACPDYIYGNGCKVPDSEKRCPYLHLCRFFIFGKCKNPCKYKKTHSIEQFHNAWVLTSCHMKGWAEPNVLREIIVPPMRENDEKGDSDQSEDDESYTGSDNETFQEEKQPKLTSHLDKSRENLAEDFGYDLQQNKQAGKVSRRDRFKSTEDINNKDDEPLKLSVAGNTQKYEDEIDIKEKERLLMEEWNRSMLAKSSAKSTTRAGDFEETSRKPTNPSKPVIMTSDRSSAQEESISRFRHTPFMTNLNINNYRNAPVTSTSNTSSLKEPGAVTSRSSIRTRDELSAFAPRRTDTRNMGFPTSSLKEKPDAITSRSSTRARDELSAFTHRRTPTRNMVFPTTDGILSRHESLRDGMTNTHFQEKNSAMLKEDSDKTNICIFVTLDRCKSGSCARFHMKSGLPYLWQIKLFGEWISFTTGENLMIENCFCDLLCEADSEIVVDMCAYTIHINFNDNDRIYGVIYGVDDQGGNLHDNRLDVRRLSTPSYIENMASHGYYATQWRWYYQGDSWCMYNQDMQIKLEKSYLSNQSRVDYGSTYTVMLDKMKQKNIATQTVRHIIRRPLFVSLSDITDGKFPKQIQSQAI